MGDWSGVQRVAARAVRHAGHLLQGGRRRAKNRQWQHGAAIGLGLVALALAGGMAYYVVSRSRVSGGSTVVGTDQQTLLEQIAALDTQFAQGRLKEAVYRHEREALKDELRRLWN